MELYQIRSFVAVAEEGNLTRAAKRLHSSQPAVSAHIKFLESEMGLTLFERTPKGMFLTPDGDALKAEADRVLSAVAGMMQTARNRKGVLSEDVSIVLNSEPEFLKTRDFIETLHKDYPGLAPRFSQNISGEVIQEVALGKADVGYAFGDIDHPDVGSIFLKTFSMDLVGPRTWADKLSVAGWEDIATFPWIGIPANCPYHQVITRLFDSEGLTASFVAMADHEATLKTMVSAGMGMTLLTHVEAVQAEDAGLVSIWRSGVASLDLSFVYPRKRGGDPAIKALCETVSWVWAVEP